MTTARIFWTLAVFCLFIFALHTRAPGKLSFWAAKLPAKLLWRATLGRRK